VAAKIKVESALRRISATKPSSAWAKFVFYQSPASMRGHKPASLKRPQSQLPPVSSTSKSPESITAAMVYKGQALALGQPRQEK